MFEITQAQLEQMWTCVKRTQCQPDCPYLDLAFDCILIQNPRTDLPNYSYRLFKGLEAALAKLEAATELLKKADELTDRLIKEKAEVIAERDFLAGELGGLPCYTRRDWQCPDFVRHIAICEPIAIAATPPRRERGVCDAQKPLESLSGHKQFY